MISQDFKAPPLTMVQKSFSSLKNHHDPMIQNVIFDKAENNGMMSQYTFSGTNKLKGHHGSVIGIRNRFQDSGTTQTESGRKYDVDSVSVLTHGDDMFTIPNIRKGELIIKYTTKPIGGLSGRRRFVDSNVKKITGITNEYWGLTDREVEEQNTQIINDLNSNLEVANVKYEKQGNEFFVIDNDELQNTSRFLQKSLSVAKVVGGVMVKAAVSIAISYAVEKAVQFGLSYFTGGLSNLFLAVPSESNLLNNTLTNVMKVVNLKTEWDPFDIVGGIGSPISMKQKDVNNTMSGNMIVRFTIDNPFYEKKETFLNVNKDLTALAAVMDVKVNYLRTEIHIVSSLILDHMNLYTKEFSDYTTMKTNQKTFEAAQVAIREHFSVLDFFVDDLQKDKEIKDYEDYKNMERIQWLPEMKEKKKKSERINLIQKNINKRENAMAKLVGTEGSILTLFTLLALQLAVVPDKMTDAGNTVYKSLFIKNDKKILSFVLGLEEISINLFKISKLIWNPDKFGKNSIQRTIINSLMDDNSHITIFEKIFAILNEVEYTYTRNIDIFQEYVKRDDIFEGIQIYQDFLKSARSLRMTAVFFISNSKYLKSEEIKIKSMKLYSDKLMKQFMIVALINDFVKNLRYGKKKKKNAIKIIKKKFDDFRNDIKIMEGLDHLMNNMRVNVEIKDIGLHSYFCLSQMFNALIYGSYSMMLTDVVKGLIKMYRYNDVNYLSPRMSGKFLPDEIEKILFQCGVKLSPREPSIAIEHVERIRFFAFQTFKHHNFLFLIATIWSLMNAQAEVDLTNVETMKKLNKKAAMEGSEEEKKKLSEDEIALLYSSISDYFSLVHLKNKDDEHSPFDLEKLSGVDVDLKNILKWMTMHMIFEIPIKKSYFSNAQENPYVNLILSLYYNYVVTEENDKK